MTESPYYTVAEVMELLKVSRATVARRLADKTFTRVTLPKSRAVRIPAVEVDALVPKRRRRAA
jgi:excisionase family DNA binding protein